MSGIKSKPDYIASFIIPNWNHRQLLYECISSICETIGNLKHEIIVVDNASTDGSAEYIKKAFPDVIWFQNNTNNTNLGYAKAINQGVKQSQGDFLFLLNNDTKLMEDTIEKLLSFLIENPDAGVVAPLLVYPDGRLQISCRRFPTPAALILEKFRIYRVGHFRRWKLTEKEHLKGGPVPQPMASALMVKRECWNAVGSMDERFPLFFNDVNWCYRLYKNTNYKIFMCIDAKIIHHLGASVNTLGLRKKWEFYKGLIRFYFKHFSFKAEIVGSSAALVNLLLMVLFVEVCGFKTYFLKNLANILAIELSIAYNFTFSRLWTWNDAPKKQGKSLIIQFISFNSRHLQAWL